MNRLGINIIKCLALALCLSFFFFSCKKKKKEDMAPFAKVTLDANPTSDPKLDSITLEYYVYDTEQGFKDGAASPTPTNFLFSGTVTGSKIEIPQLTSGVDHYVLVRYFDTKSFPGFSILYTNEEGNYLISALEDQAELEADIKLKAQEGLFTFYSQSDNASILPISITVGKKNPLPINLSGASQTIKLRKGTYPMKGTSVGVPSCIWMKTAEIVPAQNTLVEYETCEFGQVAFYSPTVSSAGIKIFIGVGGRENLIDTLRTSSSGISNCSDPNSVFTVLEPGNYSYYAIDEGTKCTWSGTFTLGSGACQTIELKTCR